MEEQTITCVQSPALAFCDTATFINIFRKEYPSANVWDIVVSQGIHHDSGDWYVRIYFMK